MEPEPQDPLWKLMIEAMKDPTLIFLTVAAFISLFIGVFIEQKPLGWLVLFVCFPTDARAGGLPCDDWDVL